MHIYIQNRLRLRLAVILTAVAALAAGVRGGTDNPDRWSFDVVPYLWLPGYEGTFDVPDAARLTPYGHTESTGGFATTISAAFMMTAQVQYREFGLLLDGAWLQLKTEGSFSGSQYSGAEIKSDIAYGTAALSYELPPLAALKTDLYAGARTWYLGNEIEFKPGTAPGSTVEDSRVFADPIVGAVLRYDISKHWFPTVMGDVGGFGLGSDLSWQVFGGVGYRFTDWFSATLGYRYMHLDYENDGFLFDANIQGVLIGLGFHF